MKKVRYDVEDELLKAIEDVKETSDRVSRYSKKILSISEEVYLSLEETLKIIEKYIEYSNTEAKYRRRHLIKFEKPTDMVDYLEECTRQMKSLAGQLLEVNKQNLDIIRHISTALKSNGYIA